MPFFKMCYSPSNWPDVSCFRDTVGERPKINNSTDRRTNDRMGFREFRGKMSSLCEDKHKIEISFWLVQAVLKAMFYLQL